MNLTSVVVEVDQMLSNDQSMEYSLSDDRWLYMGGDIHDGVRHRRAVCYFLVFFNIINNMYVL